MKHDDLEIMLTEAIAPQRSTMRWTMVMAAIAALASVVLLGVSGWFLTGAAIAGLGGAAAVQAFNYMLPSACIRMTAILRTVTRYGERYYGHRATMLALATVRGRLFAHIMKARDVRAFSAGDAVSRLVQDISALEDRVIRKPALPAAIAGAGVAITLTALSNIWAALMLATLLWVVIFVSRWISPILLRGPAHDMAEALARLREDMVGYAQASPEIVAYAMAPALQNVLEDDARKLDDARLRLARGEAIVGNALLTLGAGIAMAFILVLTAGSSLPLRVLAVLASAGAMESLGGLVRGIIRDAIVQVGLARLKAIGAPHEISQGVALVEPAGRDIVLPSPSGGVVHLEVGDRLAIIGPSGCGKTRLIEGLAGLRPDDVAGILIDSHLVAYYAANDVRALFALSSQDAVLISGTVRDNLRLARSGLSDDDLWSALDVACFADDVRAMPDGLDHWVGDGGARLSGGQKKRLSLARALLAGRPWLLLDEPSEGLDRVTEQLLLNRLGRWLEATRTGLILISHRPAMLVLCDKRLDFDGISATRS